MQKKKRGERAGQGRGWEADGGKGGGEGGAGEDGEGREGGEGGEGGDGGGANGRMGGRNEKTRRACEVRVGGKD